MVLCWRGWRMTRPRAELRRRLQLHHPAWTSHHHESQSDSQSPCIKEIHHARWLRKSSNVPWNGIDFSLQFIFSIRLRSSVQEMGVVNYLSTKCPICVSNCRSEGYWKESMFHKPASSFRPFLLSSIGKNLRFLISSNKSQCLSRILSKLLPIFQRHAHCP